MRDYKSAPGCAGAKLVVFETWESFGYSYWAYIRWTGARFCFEGRIRIANSRHTYFPDSDWQQIDVGNAQKCISFIEETLWKHGCPKDIREALKDKVREWKSQ